MRNVVENIPCVLSLIWLSMADYWPQRVDLEVLGRRGQTVEVSSGPDTRLTQ